MGGGHREDSSTHEHQGRFSKATEMGSPHLRSVEANRRSGYRAPGPLPVAWGCWSFLLPPAVTLGERNEEVNPWNAKETFRPKETNIIDNDSIHKFCHQQEKEFKTKWYMIIKVKFPFCTTDFYASSYEMKNHWAGWISLKGRARRETKHVNLRSQGWKKK